jgi:hypothetical protein
MRLSAPIAVCFLAVPFLLVGQGFPPREASLLLPETQLVSGVVSDSLGVPIPGASIHHLGRLSREGSTDSTGHFALSTRAPAFVISKIGYESAFVRTENAHSVQIILKQIQGRIPACSSKNLCTSVNGFGNVFCLTGVKGVKISDQVNDIDYGNRIYSVKSKSGRQVMQHAGGPMWGAGLPFDENVWTSIEYSEKTYANGSQYVVDARGKSSSGKLWRSIGRFGETASYYDVDHGSATLFDRVLDGMCIQQEKTK